MILRTLSGKCVTESVFFGLYPSPISGKIPLYSLSFGGWDCAEPFFGLVTFKLFNLKEIEIFCLSVKGEALNTLGGTRSSCSCVGLKRPLSPLPQNLDNFLSKVDYASLSFLGFFPQ